MECPRCGVEESPIDRICHTPFCLYNGFEKRDQEERVLVDFSLKSLQAECARKHVAYNPGDTREVLGQRLRQDLVNREEVWPLAAWRAWLSSRLAATKAMSPMPQCAVCRDP